MVKLTSHPSGRVEEAVVYWMTNLALLLDALIT